jgi:plasmid stabilization system protein ParE
MARAVWTPIAESELDDILFYIALVDRKPATGERIYYEIRDRVAEHATRGLPGQKHPDAPESWLYLRHKRWLIFYQPHPEGIEVLRIVDSVRDMPSQL